MSANYQLMKNPLDRTEYKGLLVTQVDPNLANLASEFQKQVVHDSHLVQDTIHRSQQMRPTTKGSSYTRMRMAQKKSEDKVTCDRKLSLHKQYLTLEQNADQLKELDDFDKRVKAKAHKMGFPGMTLEAMKSL